MIGYRGPARGLAAEPPEDTLRQRDQVVDGCPEAIGAYRNPETVDDARQREPAVGPPPKSLLTCPNDNAALP